MRIIAFKQAKDTLAKDHLPDDHIVEWTYADLLQSLDGWQTITEDKFMKNKDDKIKVWKDKKDKARKDKHFIKMKSK